MPTIAPYGSWESSVTTAVMTEKTTGLSAPVVDLEAILWLESRPHEGGRTTLIRWTEETGAVEMTPAPFDVGNRVHEYGGGGFAVLDGFIVFSDRNDAGVRLISQDGTMRVLALTKACRFADFSLDLGRDRVICIREDHRGGPETAPQAAIVALSFAPDTDPQIGEILVEGPDFLASPRISPDGSRLAWVAWDHPNMPWDHTTLWVGDLGADGMPESETLVAGTAEEAILQPEWHGPNAVVFASDRDEWWNLYRWDGEHISALGPIDSEIGSPAWAFGQRYFTCLAQGSIICTLIKNGRSSTALLESGTYRPLPLGQFLISAVPYRDGVAALGASPDSLPCIVRLERLDSSSWTILRESGPKFLQPDDISNGEAISFASGNGAESYATFYSPKNRLFEAPPDERPPLIIMVHGGPTSMSGNGFSLKVQWWTSRGFAVADVNYRGSTGFGRTYRRALDGQWGVADVEDCIAAATHLGQTGLIDSDRIAIRGGSAGGFTVLAALTRSTVFKAGASLYGIGDLALLARDTHKFESRYLDRLVGTLPEDAAVFAERSPLNHIDALTAPIIFFQGADDRVVPPNQAEIMVDAMRAKGLPVAHYVFEGEGHGFRRAETLQRVLDLELSFYGVIFGFERSDLAERVVLLG